MKKVVRMLGLCALVALAFTSCKKNETNSTLTFGASITQPKSADRTYVALNNKLAWHNNDNILVFDATKANYDFTVSSTGEQAQYDDVEATFNVTDPAKVAFLKDIETPGKYVAFYPQAQFDEANNTVSMTIPNVQTYNHNNAYEQGSFVANTYPMFGMNDAANHFQFHSHAGVVQFQFGALPNRYAKVTQIIVSKWGTPLVGTMTYPKDYPFSAYDAEADAYTTTFDIVNDTMVVLNCGDGVELPATPSYSKFQMVFLRGALNEGFNVKVIGDKDDQNTGEILNNQVIFESAAVVEDNTFDAEKIHFMTPQYIPIAGTGGEPLNP